MSLETQIYCSDLKPISKVRIDHKIGPFTVRTANSEEELRLAYKLRHQVFQVEGADNVITNALDTDRFDCLADHIIVFDDKSGQLIATCRLICSKFSNSFYSAEEFQFQELLEQDGVKLELGRVCIDERFRKGIVILTLWRAIADYMSQVKAHYLFGCASVLTEDAEDSALLYRYLTEQGYIQSRFSVKPTQKYRFGKMERLVAESQSASLTEDHKRKAKALLPALCRSYFDIGCFSSGYPALDKDFKCIDFFTVLDVKQLDRQVAKKMFGEIYL